MRIAVASTPLTATLEEAVPAAVAAVEEAGRLGASVVCLPETGLPGHRLQDRAVPEITQEQLGAALGAVAAAAAAAGVVTIVGAERPTAAGREIVSFVLGADGARLGEQVKTQVAPEEDGLYAPGSGRRTFTAGVLTFAIAICHEAFRYPEIVRGAAAAGAQVVFVPHFVRTDDGTLPTSWCDPGNPYQEHALRCRALESTVYVAAANVACPDQGSASCVVDPGGALAARVPYGAAAVAAADVDLARADAFLARRWAPERNNFDAPPPGASPG